MIVGISTNLQPTVSSRVSFVRMNHPVVRRSLGPVLAALALLPAAAFPLRAQEPVLSTQSTEALEDPRALGQRAQARFETFRRANLPFGRGRGSNECQEQVGYYVVL